MKYIVVFLLPIYCVLGQASITHQSQIWYGYYLTYSIKPNLYLQGELHERHFVDPFLHHQSAFRGHLHRTFGRNWDLSLGAALFLNTPNDVTATNRLAIPEYRPHIDVLYKHSWSAFRIDHRLRSEARFNQVTNAAKTELADDVHFSNYRFRYRIQAQFPLLKKVYGKINTEILLNVEQENPENVLDQHRMFAGISIPLKTNLTLDVGYLHAFQQRPNLNYYDRSMLSLMLYHRIN